LGTQTNKSFIQVLVVFITFFNYKSIHIDAKLENIQLENQFFHLVYSFCGDITIIISTASVLIILIEFIKTFKT
jgi:hypothetical protein